MSARRIARMERRAARKGLVRAAQTGYLLRGEAMEPKPLTFSPRVLPGRSSLEWLIAVCTHPVVVVLLVCVGVLLFAWIMGGCGGRVVTSRPDRRIVLCEEVTIGHVIVVGEKCHEVWGVVWTVDGAPDGGP